MFTPDYFIDTVQNGKRFVVNTFVTDAKIKTGLNDFIDAQTEFAKVVFKNALMFTEVYTSNVTNAFKTTSK